MQTILWLSWFLILGHFKAPVNMLNFELSHLLYQRLDPRSIFFQFYHVLFLLTILVFPNVELLDLSQNCLQSSHLHSPSLLPTPISSSCFPIIYQDQRLMWGQYSHLFYTLQFLIAQTIFFLVRQLHVLFLTEKASLQLQSLCVIPSM